MARLRKVGPIAGLWASILLGGLLSGVAAACPFCSAVSLTFCEEVNSSDVAVVARLAKLPSEAKPGSALGADGKAHFEILKVLKGEKALGNTRTFDTLYFGNSPVGSTFLVMGVEPPTINWSTPIPLSERGREYLDKALELPKEGAERLAFFQDYLEDGDEMLARDAYDEFAKMPFAGVKELKDRMHHDKLVSWVQDQKIAPSRRRLYLTMLGVCGTPKDAEMLEQMMRSSERQVKSGLDALLAAYLTLVGPDGMKLVEDLFLKDQNADYTDTYAAIMALRFHGQEEKIIPRKRLLEGMHYMLNRPQLADLVIPDLARWQDWSVMDRLVELFKNADDESSWVRVPVINYLRACPLPKARQYIDELNKLDPESVKKANSFFPFGTAAPAAQDKAAPVSKDKPQSANGKKVSAAPAGRKARQAQKPVDDQASADAQAKRGQAGAPAKPTETKPTQAAAATARLSRAAAPGAVKAPQVAPLQVLGWMALVGGVLTIFLIAILRGGQEVAG